MSFSWKLLKWIYSVLEKSSSYYKNNLNINIDVITCKYFQNIYCIGVYLYMHNIHNTHR